MSTPRPASSNYSKSSYTDVSASSQSISSQSDLFALEYLLAQLALQRDLEVENDGSLHVKPLFVGMDLLNSLSDLLSQVYNQKDTAEKIWLAICNGII